MASILKLKDLFVQTIKAHSEAGGVVTIDDNVTVNGTLNGRPIVRTETYYSPAFATVGNGGSLPTWNFNANAGEVALISFQISGRPSFDTYTYWYLYFNEVQQIQTSVYCNSTWIRTLYTEFLVTIPNTGSHSVRAQLASGGTFNDSNGHYMFKVTVGGMI